MVVVCERHSKAPYVKKVKVLRPPFFGCCGYLDITHNIRQSHHFALRNGAFLLL
jgi:hypothetical protein